MISMFSIFVFSALSLASEGNTPNPAKAYNASASASPTENTVVENYVRAASEQYNFAFTEAVEFQKTIEEFLRAPSAETLQVAKNQWIEMRKAYSPSEVFRFYGGPIDDEDGPEGLLNAWPLDEAYIDSVVGMPDSGIIHDRTTYPTITKELLLELNEKNGEKNISIGYHALEFLLWGQDLSMESAGNRSFTDYLPGAKNFDRRRDYLKITTDLLVDHLRSLQEEWDLSKPTSYGNQFLTLDSKEALRNLLLGVYKLSGEELSQERMFVAYDTQAEEDEHSCFSDTTHLDLRYNFLGLKNVLQEKTDFLRLLEQKNPRLAKEIKEKLELTEKEIFAIPAPFDNAIFDEEARKTIKASVDHLVDLAELVNLAAKDFGIQFE